MIIRRARRSDLKDEIFAGALVRKVSGGPVMVVQAIGEGGLGVGTCARGVWFERGQFTVAEIPVADLVMANKSGSGDRPKTHTAGQPFKRLLSRGWRAHENKLKIICARCRSSDYRSFAYIMWRQTPSLNRHDERTAERDNRTAPVAACNDPGQPRQRRLIGHGYLRANREVVPFGAQRSFALAFGTQRGTTNAALLLSRLRITQCRYMLGGKPLLFLQPRHGSIANHRYPPRVGEDGKRWMLMRRVASDVCQGR